MAILELTAGAVLALITVAAARRFSLAWERGFYAGLVVAVAVVYPLAVAWAALRSPTEPGVSTLAAEAVASVCFVALALGAWKREPALIPLAFAAHAAWDFSHLGLAAALLPEWYPGLCLSYDLVLVVYAASRLGDWRVLLPVGAADG